MAAENVNPEITKLATHSVPKSPHYKSPNHNVTNQVPGPGECTERNLRIADSLTTKFTKLQFLKIGHTHITSVHAKCSKLNAKE